MNSKIKLLILLFFSPVFSFLNGEVTVSEWSELGYLWGFPAELADTHQESDSSEKDFSVYQLTLHAVNMTAGQNTLSSTEHFIKTSFSTSNFIHFQTIAERAFLIAHQFSSSYLKGHNQQYSLPRFLLLEVFLI